jgi:hypothetical protein
MNHLTQGFCVALVTTSLFFGPMLACGKNIPPAAYLTAVDCQYHVLDNAFSGNPELIDKVLEVGQGPFQLEEYVDIATSLGKSDVDIVAYGKALNECLPVELRATMPIMAPPPSYGNKIVTASPSLRSE